METYCADDIIFSLATPWGTGALAVIRISGNGCLEKTAPHFSGGKKLEESCSGCAVYGNLAGIDRCLVTAWKDGHGYTGEEALEISCHGGMTTVSGILEFLQSLGMRQAGRGEFTLRAFMHGKMDLTRAEAVAELIDSRTDSARAASLSRLEGSLHKRIQDVRNAVLDVMGTIEVQLDYAEDETEPDIAFPRETVIRAIGELNGIRSTYTTGKLYSQGAMVVLAGAVNAGKSSLFNCMLREDRAIVSPVEGTTRDFLEGSCVIDGIPVRLVDTAGLRSTGSAVEQEGIRRSRAMFENADIILYLRSPDDGSTDSELENDPRCIPVASKSDLLPKVDAGKSGIRVSVVTGEGYTELCKAISAKLREGVPQLPEGALTIQSERQKMCLDRACEALSSALGHEENGVALDIIAIDVREALDALGELTGEVTTEDILDNVFSNFCVGK